MADTNDVKTDEPVLKFGGAYKESDTHVPNPTSQYGTLDTTDTAGSADHSMEDISPVFAAAKAQNLLQAARALDPEDTAVPASLVVLPDEGMTAEQARENVLGQAKALSEDKVEVADETSPSKEAAAETDEGTDGQKTARVQAEQEDQGAGSLGGTGLSVTNGLDPDSRTTQSEGNEKPKAGADKAQNRSADARGKAQGEGQKAAGDNK